MSAPKKKPKENPHEHHRQRMLALYEAVGFDSLSDHNILEILLFFSIRRANTNPTAHALIDRFGSLYDVLTAQPEELQEVYGIGPSSAQLIRSTFDAARTAVIRKIMERPIEDYVLLHRIAIDWLADKLPDTVSALYLDDKLRALDLAPLHDRNNFPPNEYAPVILSHAQACGASRVVLMHKHETKNVQPSEIDLITTQTLISQLKTGDVLLMEHLIVHEFDVYPILQNSMGTDPFPNAQI